MSKAITDTRNAILAQYAKKIKKWLKDEEPTETNVKQYYEQNSIRVSANGIKLMVKYLKNPPENRIISHDTEN